LPKIRVPTIVIHGADDEVNPVKRSEGHQRFFAGPYERRVFERVGHNPPQEDPEKFARAIVDLCARTSH
jgi:pimeloyl-ACP methyl ester carboxylesterase